MGYLAWAQTECRARKASFVSLCRNSVIRSNWVGVYLGYFLLFQNFKLFRCISRETVDFEIPISRDSFATEAPTLFLTLLSILYNTG